MDQQKASGNTGNQVEQYSALFIIVLLVLIFRSLTLALVTIAPAVFSVIISGPLVAEAAQHGLQVSPLAQYLMIVLVLGAGIAGLAAAECLAAAGRGVLILEARDRLGGRIHTVDDPALGHPIELGAEFVHGRPADLVGLIRKSGLTLERMPTRHRGGRGRAPTPVPDIRDTLARLLDPAGGPLPDMPVAALLRQRRAELPSPAGLDPVARYLEGFHAADLGRFGTRSLAENEAAEDEDGDDPHRVREGYGALVQRLAARLDPDRAEIRLETVVASLRWRGFQPISRTPS